jgi:hypothetical protein
MIDEKKRDPIPMRLCCEGCGELHIDEGEFATKPHHTHSCQHCGLTWRPAVVPTVGVRFLPGFKNEASKYDRTIFGCRACDRSTWGGTDGRFEDAGWSRIENIDGPNAICPHCQQDDTALAGLREDYPKARVASGKR